jgi:hypothetical protein
MPMRVRDPVTTADPAVPAVLRITAPKSSQIKADFRVGESVVKGEQHDEMLRVFMASELPAMDARFYTADTSPSKVLDVARQFADAVLPQRVQAEIGSWQTSQAGRAVLAVSAVPSLGHLPWELLASRFGDQMFVVRMRYRTGGRTRRPGLDVPCPVVAAGWEELPGRSTLPGIAREMNDLGAATSEEFSVLSLRNPPVPELERRLQDTGAEVLHLSVASGFRAQDPLREGPVELGLFPTSGLANATDQDVVRWLQANESVRLVIVNTMPNPVVADSPLLGRLCTDAGVAVVGWGGTLADSIAVDFAKYWYQRAAEGLTLVEISQSFTRQFGHAQWASGATPIVWVPSASWLTRPVLQTKRTRIEGAGGYLFASVPFTAPDPIAPETDVAAGSTAARSSEPVVDVHLDLQSSLFPALLVNGVPPIRALSVDSDRDFRGRIELECDVGGRTSTHRVTRTFVVGTSTVPSEEIKFPAIYDLIGSNERRVISITASVYADELLAQTTKTVDWLSRRDWLNDANGWPYVAAYVLPMTAAIAEVVNEAQAILVQISSPGARFEGYARHGAGADDPVRSQMRSIFQAVRSMGIRYIAPPGLPPHVFNPMRMDPDDPVHARTTEPTAATDQALTGQLVRTPADILERCHGTCHDLALLFAAAAEYVNLYPLVILMPGHTYFGYWSTREAHTKFWIEETHGSSPSDRPWTIASTMLTQLIADGSVEVVEPNMACHSQATFDQAVQRARGYADGVNQVVDVQRSRRWVQPIALL